MQRTRRGAAHISRRDFLRLGGAGLAGAALLGTAGCGGGSQSSGNEVIFSWGEDDTGVLPGFIEEFNKQNEGNIKVTHRVMPSDTGQYFDQIRTEFQAGGGDIDVIGGDVIWPAQFAANGYILDLSDRFTDTDAFLPGPIQSNTYDGKVWGVPWYTDAGLLYYRQDLLEQAGFSESVAGLQTEHSIVADGVAPQAVSTYKEPETKPAFLGGRSVFARNWPYMYALAPDPKISKLKPDQIGIAPLPAGEGGQSFSGLGRT